MNLYDYPYFTTFQRTYLIIQTVLAAIGVFVNSLWGIKLYKNNEHSDIFTYNIALADGLKALSNHPILTTDILHQENQRNMDPDKLSLPGPFLMSQSDLKIS
ncbi:hypothetical protein BC833DRAFT_568475 [Globomyces pollinis-pini]|nr:hypothetical protein BC833DRAFT_568475 [Globomyces pollinis-pini]